MKYIKLLIVIHLLAFTYVFSLAQVPIGEWQDYLSFSKVHSVKKVNNHIYAATSVGLFSYDEDDYILQKHTKINGLSDIAICAIAPIPNSNKLFIGYENGNIDIFENGDVQNIPDLKMKSMNNSKRINHIAFINDKAFCSTDFGILVVDYNKLEISDFYYIGDNASNLKIYQLCQANDSIYAASEKGVRGAPKNSNALSFYETWKIVSPDDFEYRSIIAIDEKVIAAKENSNTHEINIYEKGNWTSFISQSNFIGLDSFKDNFALISKNEIKIYSNQLTQVDKINSYEIENDELTPSFSALNIDENGTRWVGDATNGLIQISQSNDFQILPDGPNSNQCFKLMATKKALYVAAGTYNFTPSPSPAECSILKNNSWIHLTSNTEPKFTNKYNICDIAINPKDDNQVFLASCRNGIFELNNDTVSYLYDETNSAIQRVYLWELVGGIALDNNGNLFANNQEVSYPFIVKPFGVKDDSTKWYKYDYMKNDDPDNQTWLRQMLYTSWGHIWSIAIVDPAGLFVFDTNNTIETDSDDQYKGVRDDIIDSRFSLLEIWDESGKPMDLSPLCLAEDNNGYIWIGTSSGIVVYYRPREIFNSSKPIASKIKVPRNDGSGLANYLLEKESISAIAVDGANRKWIGTRSNGIFLVSSDGTNTLHEFNTENSSLISNNITSISINPESGEVFIGTDKGIVSYRGTAIEAKETYSNVIAFPNPVNPNYEGVITVKGLMENSPIRITDISGKVVYEAISTGGQVVWNGKNVYNEKVSSGVYLVFATNSDGSESMVTKIMIIK